MNPSWGSLMDEAAKRDADRKNAKPSAPVSSERYLKQEVDYQHPASGADVCRDCIHFSPPHACKLVTGYIRREDWCNKWEESK